MHRIFTSFEEIRTDLTANAPPIVYKYRTWNDENHRKLLTQQEVWFSHPFDLNDPLDVRPDIVIDPEELKRPAFLQKLMNTVAEAKPELVSERDRLVVAENQFELLKDRPQLIAENRRDYLANEENFDSYGVFSTTTNSLSDKLWSEYGDNYAGYAIGFKTVELCCQMKSGYGYVDYSDKPLPFSFLNRTEEEDLNSLYYKKEIWQEEDEFRFITLGIGRHSQRLQKFSLNTVSEIILGHNISFHDEQEILEVAGIYSVGLPVYKTRKNHKGQLNKERIR